MRTIAIMSGRFNPPHLGHKAVYDQLVKKFGAANAYVVSSDKQDPIRSPFSFVEKKALWKTLSVPDSHIIQVKNPYNPVEITSKFDSNKTAIVFAVSQKDATRFSFGPKKDGSLSYMQPMTDKMLPLSKHGYVEITPTVEFSVAGQPVTGATQIRDMYITADDKQRNRILLDLYGKVTPAIKKLFDKNLKATVTESLIREFVEFIKKF
jgi:hypothetical protein